MAFALDNQCLIVIKIYAADDLMNGVGESTTPNSMYFSIYSFICLFVFAHWLLWCVNFEPLNLVSFCLNPFNLLNDSFYALFYQDLFDAKQKHWRINSFYIILRKMLLSWMNIVLRFWLNNYSTINPEKYCHRPGTKFSHLAKFHSFHSIFEIINGQNA